MEPPSSIAASLSLLEIDHILLYLTDGQLGASVLEELGFTVSAHTIGNANQGTASKLIFFENAYIELIWIEDEDAAEQYGTQTGADILNRTRWQQTRASPFGISLRHRSNLTALQSYSRQPWAESIQFNTLISFSAENLASTAEPLCFLIPEQLALTNWLDLSSEFHQRLVAHPLGVKTLTDVKFTITGEQDLSETPAYLAESGIITIERGISPLLELTFDHGYTGKLLDARPVLPVLIKL